MKIFNEQGLINMSSTIKDYKNAMDSIKISDSYHKRTETLLNGLLETESEKKAFYSAIWVIVSVAIILIIALKMIYSRQRGTQ